MGRVETTRDEWPGRVETGPREHHLRKRGFIMLKSCKINIPSKRIPFEVRSWQKDCGISFRRELLLTAVWCL